LIKLDSLTPHSLYFLYGFSYSGISMPIACTGTMKKVCQGGLDKESMLLLFVCLPNKQIENNEVA
jgi:hypothetical protein